MYTRPQNVGKTAIHVGELPTGGPEPPASRGAGARLVFLDVLRLVAAVQMIQGHSIDAVLAPAHRTGAPFALWTFVRGLTSVTFLLSAGLSFVVAEARAHDAQARRRRALRALRLVAIGYLMHAPLGLWLGSPRDATLARALVVDILQCIGVTMLALELLAARIESPRARSLLALTLAVFCFAAAPLTESLALAPALRPLGNYLTARDGSLFPLLPWAGYVLIGFGLGTQLLAPGRAPARVGVGLASAGGCALALGLATMPLCGSLSRAVSPAYALVKVGGVLLAAALLARGLGGRARLPRWLEVLASETLVLYVSHVVVLYADHVGVAVRVGPVLSPGESVRWALGLIIASGLLALFVNALRSALGGGTRGAKAP